MFNRNSETQPEPLDDVINNLLSEMAGHEGNTEEYTVMCQNVKTLYEAKALVNKPSLWTSDTMLTVAGNLLGIFAILGYERANVVTSKALGFVIKPKS